MKDTAEKVSDRSFVKRFLFYVYECFLTLSIHTSVPGARIIGSSDLPRGC